MKPRSIDNIAGHQFRWLRAIRDGLATEKRRQKAEREAGIKGLPARITEADVVFAVDLTEFMQGRLDCFRSAAALAVACGYSENAADAGLRRLVDAGFLEKLPPEKGDTNGKGRPASRYRVPDNFPILDWGNISPSCIGENTAISPSQNETLSPSPLGNDQRDDQKRAKAPKAPSALISVSPLSTVVSESGGKIGDDPDFPPLSEEQDSGPTEEDEPIIITPDDPCPLPEIPATIEREWREAEEHLPPPDPRYPDDDPDHLAEVENLTGDDASAFVDAWTQGFIGGDTGCAATALATVKRASRLTMHAFPSSPDAVTEFLIAPLLQHLSQIAEGRRYDPETVDTALEEFRAAVETLPDAETTERKAAHG